MAVEIAVSVCGALDAAHSCDVVHRDVSPGNIMVCEDGAVKVLDFGIALIADTGLATTTGMVRGTPAYLSPEQAEGKPLDARSDLYSLGCCLYQMITGRPPFDGPTPAAFAYQHVNKPPLEPRSVDSRLSPALQEVVLRAMAKDPGDRYPTAAAMADALAAARSEALSEPGRTDGAAPPTRVVTSSDATKRMPASSAERTDQTTQIRSGSADGAPIEGMDAVDNEYGNRRRRLGLILILVSVAVIIGAAAVFISRALAT